MKVKIDKATLTHVISYCDYAPNMRWANALHTTMVQEQLQLLGNKCKRKTHQESTTLNVTAAEAFAMNLLVNLFNSPSALVVREFFMNPLLKQLQ